MHRSRHRNFLRDVRFCFIIVIISEVVSAYVHHLLQVAVVVVIELGFLGGVCGGGHVAVVVIYT